MTHLARAVDYLDLAAAHLRVAAADELDPVAAVIAESVLIGWKRDRAVLAQHIDKETS